MLSETLKKHAEQRRKRFIEYIEQGLSSYEIGEREGMAADAARTERGEIAREENLTVKRPGRDSYVPLGLKEVDAPFRTALAQKVDDLRRRHHFKEVCRLTGLSNAAQKRAQQGKHNWNLGEIYRLSQAVGMSFRDLIAEANASPVIGFERKKS